MRVWVLSMVVSLWVSPFDRVSLSYLLNDATLRISREA